MREIKDSKQATVHVGYDGRVHKRFHGPMASERFANEVRVLRLLEERGCDFVPRVIEADPADLYLVTTNCGKIVDKISQERMDELFAELESYGVRHEDRFARNVTYSARMGRFCLIDFEFATILENGEGLTLADVEAYNQSHKPTVDDLPEPAADATPDCSAAASTAHRDAAEAGQPPADASQKPSSTQQVPQGGK